MLNSRTHRAFVLAAATVAFASGCSVINSKGSDYRTEGRKVPSLEVPPDLTSPIADDRFFIPDAKATTYSAYNRERGAAPVATATTSGVLAKIENARIERSGDQRWLVVRSTPDKLWPIIKAFWTEAGFVVKRETPASGIMETDWAENRAKIPQDFIRNTVGKLLDGLYSTGERDRFRTRLEAGSESGTTEIFISHRGLEEVYTSPKEDSTKWQFRKSDPELEAEMLSRLMVKLGFAEGAKPVVATSASVGAGADGTRATYNAASSDAVRMPDAFDRAWRRVGLALDGSGFTVEDRDRTKGLFFVRYQDPDAEAGAGKSKGFLDKLAFWRKDDPASKANYRIFVADAPGGSSVVVQTADGKTDTSATAKRILSLLYTQLK